MSEQHKTHDSKRSPLPSVDTLVSAVESKMSELMAWHEMQASDFAQAKTTYEQELAQKRETLAIAQEEAGQAYTSYTARLEATEKLRVQLKEAAHALQERQHSLDQELAAAHRAREQAERAAAELEQQRTRASAQTQHLIDAVAGLGTEPVVIGDIKPKQSGKKNKHHVKHAA